MEVRSKRKIVLLAVFGLASILIASAIAINDGTSPKGKQSAVSHSTAAPTPLIAGPPLHSTSTSIAPARKPPSGEAMPVGDLPGWKQIFTDDFNIDAAIGTFTNSPYASEWDVYPDGTKDTAAQNEDEGGRYYPSKVLSVKQGVLNKYVHSENEISMGAAIIAKRSYNQTYGRYSVRFRADSVTGYKIAWLLWPDSDEWPDDGEIDFPEGDLDGEIHAAAHYAQPWNGDFARDLFDTDAQMDDWHTATTEWTPGQIAFYLDGKLIGTSTHKVPDSPMHWVLQTETCVGWCQPKAKARGNVQIDWVALYKRA